MEHVLTMANLKLKPSLFTPRPNTYMDKNHDKIGNFSKLRTLLVRRSYNNALKALPIWHIMTMAGSNDRQK